MAAAIGDLPAIEAALHSAFPALGGRIAPLRVLGDDFRAVGVETADGWVFRIGEIVLKTGREAGRLIIARHRALASVTRLYLIPII